jgi:hypothetical protein
MREMKAASLADLVTIAAKLRLAPTLKDCQRLRQPPIPITSLAKASIAVLLHDKILSIIGSLLVERIRSGPSRRRHEYGHP